MTSGFEAFGSSLPHSLHFVLTYVLVCAIDVVSDLAAVMASAAEDTAALRALVTSYKETCDRQIAELKEIKARDAEYRQDSADLTAASERLKLDLAELRSVVTALAAASPAAVDTKIPGPTDEAGVAERLRDKASLQQAVKDYGLPWLFEVKEKGLFPAAALRDDDFMEYYLELRKSGTVITPALPAPSTSGTLPFAAALAGRHIKFELPRPSKFSRIAADSDIRAWLVRIHEYLTITGVEQNVWVVFASNYLDGAPLQLWESRKAQLAKQLDVLYSWENFKRWCISSFSVHNHERHALAELEKLRQTGTVAAYKAAHNLLASQTILPMQLRIHWWERGLKANVRKRCSVDPCTYKEYTDIDKAQSAACACEAHLLDSYVASDDEVPEPKRPRVVENTHDSRMCYKCGRIGHIASTCPRQGQSQDTELEAN